jgi:beta-phosphoglucomutase-like phosphatase (HAD superfamily)
MTDGVIFDCDGVLVDSEPLSNRVLAQMLTEVGLPTTTSAAMSEYMGSSTATVVAVVEKRLGRALPADLQMRLGAVGYGR